MSWLDFEDQVGACAGQSVKLSDGGAKAALDATDRLAKLFQLKLFARQQQALWITLIGIAILVVLACVTSNSLFTLFGPVVVFVMILRFDAIRQSATVYQFAALRLAAETIRVLMALDGKPQLRNWVLTQRLHSAHAVASLATEATASLGGETQADAQILDEMSTKSQAPAKTPPEIPTQDVWSNWREEQSAYFGLASAREAARSRRARRGFYGAFTLVALTGFSLGCWMLLDPQAAGKPLYREILAAASGCGSAGLAWITLARELKCFEQSIDYRHMHELFESKSGGVQDGTLVCEAVAEHTRWAVRMAGHFGMQPPH